MVDRGDILDEAKRLTMGDRSRTHGGFVPQHAKTAELWSAYLGSEVGAEDVAWMLLLNKVGRCKSGAPNLDNYIDSAAYAAGAGECMIDRVKGEDGAAVFHL